MDAGELSRIRAMPAFQELTRKRSAFGWTLAILMMAVYGTFMVLVAFARPLISEPIGYGVLTLAFPLGLGVIVLAIVLTGLYVLRANSEFDRLTAEIVGQRRVGAAASTMRLAEGVR